MIVCRGTQTSTADSETLVDEESVQEPEEEGSSDLFGRLIKTEEVRSKREIEKRERQKKEEWGLEREKNIKGNSDKRGNEKSEGREKSIT